MGTPVEALFTQGDAEARWSRTTVQRLFDDDQDDVADAAIVLEFIKEASAEAYGWLEPTYTLAMPLDSSQRVPRLLKRLALLYFGAMAFDRHPEYVKKYGEDPRAKGLHDKAEKLGLQLQSATKLLVEVDAPRPGNVGGPLLDGGPSLLIDPSTGRYTGGDW